MPSIRRSETNSTTSESVERTADLVDLDDISSEISDDNDDYIDKKERSAHATDVRRRIEEQLEVRMLRDELGMDDFEI